MKNLQAQIEALLFIYGEPIELKKLAKVLNSDLNKVKEALSGLEQKYREEGNGIVLINAGEKVQLGTKPEFSGLLETVVKGELQEALTPAALETLAIVAYAGPIPRSMIDYIRGVNSSFILRNLLMRGLVERASDPSRPNAFIYSASFDLMRHLGLQKLEDLPEFEKFRNIADKLKAGQ
ncbi:MAG TPA: SMC-Scp complex subunit ScpB [Candidatus Paceibacterota bacterium]